MTFGIIKTNAHLVNVLPQHKQWMSDEDSIRLRGSYIKQGIITEGEYCRPGERPFFNKETIERMKARLIKTGFLIPRRPLETTLPRLRDTDFRRDYDQHH